MPALRFSVSFVADRAADYQAIRKRLIALHLHCATSGASKGDRSLSAARGIEMLVEHLETTYSDPDGWSELCAAYERLGMLPQALSCLSDLILLQPTVTFHVLRHAEMLYTLGEYASAYKGFCRALEMAGPMSDGGAGRRAGFGVKLCLKRLGPLGEESTSRRSVDATLPRKAKDIDALVTQELLLAYGKGECRWKVETGEERLTRLICQLGEKKVTKSQDTTKARR